MEIIIHLLGLVLQFLFLSEASGDLLHTFCQVVSYSCPLRPLAVAPGQAIRQAGTRSQPEPQTSPIYKTHSTGLT